MRQMKWPPSLRTRFDPNCEKTHRPGGRRKCGVADRPQAGQRGAGRGRNAGQDGEAGKAPDGNEAPAPPAAMPGSLVPLWRQGLSAEVLAPEYQQVMGLLTERRTTDGEPLNCREITSVLGLEAVPAKIEGVRVKLKRLVARGWAHEPAPGRFACCDGRDGGS
ncbi:hypothetical protein GCM10020367_59280 [Streptomyces sannanensis]|uniref:DUF2087 domain-containing protein n=1 Tax=Streptomyces sannanensis TaxID=285536 RepID=A0ABP6SKS7_9ACTN